MTVVDMTDPRQRSIGSANSQGVTSAGAKPLLLVVDAMNLIRRIFAAQQNHQSDVAAALATQYAVLRALKQLVHSFTASHAVLVFDGHHVHPTPDGNTTASPVHWRKALYPQYKAQRQPMPKALAEQLVAMQQQLLTEHISSVEMADQEADDVVASIAITAQQAAVDVVIVSTDNGYLPLVGNGIRQYDHFAKQFYDADWISHKWGVPASQLLVLRALIGDHSNGIPGVKGIGKKTALQVVQLGSYKQAMADVSLSASQRQALTDGWLDFQLSLQLLTLKQDLVLGAKLSSWRVTCI